MTNAKSMARRFGRAGAAIAVAALLIAGLVTYTEANAAAGPKPAVTPVGATVATLTWAKQSGTDISYRVRYSTSSSMSSPKYFPSATTTTPNAFAAITGLSVNTTYYFDVGVFNSTGAQTMTYSAATSAKTSFPYTTPTGLAYANVASTSVELSFNNVSGAPGYQIRFTSASEGTQYVWSQVENYTLQGALKPKAQWANPAAPEYVGLKKNTQYKIAVAVQQPDIGTAGTAGFTPTSQMSSYTKEIAITTSNFELAAPANLAMSQQTASSMRVSWDAPSGMKAGDVFKVQYSTASSMSGAKTIEVTDPTVALTGLSSNSTYYVRVLVTRGGTQVSDASAALQIKTLISTGVLKGVVTGPPGPSVVALIYSTSGELVSQVDVAADGTYSAKVRPGNYRVKLNYQGLDGYVSMWATTNVPNGRPVHVQGTVLSVAAGKDTKVPDVKLIKGASIAGIVHDSKGVGINAVDLASLTAQTDDRDVEAVVYTPTSAAAGSYVVNGLSEGGHWLHFAKSGYTTRSVWVNVQSVSGALQVTQFRVSGLASPTNIGAGASLSVCMVRSGYPACPANPGTAVGGAAPSTPPSTTPPASTAPTTPPASTPPPATTPPATPTLVTLWSKMGANLVVDIKGGSTASGAQAHLWTTNGNPTQKFTLVCNASNVCQIVVSKSGKCLEVKNGTAAKRTPVVQNSCQNVAKQLWKQSVNSDGSVTFVSQLSGGFVLDARGGKPKKGTQLWLWTSNNLPCQRFTIAKA